MNWYSFEPADTLFFRGAQPMNIGENHTAAAEFPPPAQTIAGALRTAVLRQNNVSIGDYYLTPVNERIMSLIGSADRAAGFLVIGPLFRLGDAVFTPAPYSWFTDKRDTPKGNVRVYRSRPINNGLVVNSTGSLYWVKGEEGELETLGGRWILLSDLHSQKKEVHVKHLHDFFVDEPRTGIALEKNRRVRQHHIYSFTHARLRTGVSIVFGVDKDLPLAEEGILKLGAEQRFGIYRKISAIQTKHSNTGLYLSLSLVEGTKEANNAVVATGKVKYLGGWDMKKGFHKPMKGYFPPGSVFDKKLNGNFIEL